MYFAKRASGPAAIVTFARTDIHRQVADTDGCGIRLPPGRRHGRTIRTGVWRLYFCSLFVRSMKFGKSA